VDLLDQTMPTTGSKQLEKVLAIVSKTKDFCLLLPITFVKMFE
jgi:hypothetical protein